MMTHYVLVSLFALTPLMAALAGGAEPDASIKPIQEYAVAPNAAAFTAAKRGEPLVIRTADEAAKYFSAEALADLEKSVDFKQQVLLVFAWKGSGQDKLEFNVAESFPEQVTFTIKPGRTRDLRPHTRVFALRSNVKWSVK